MKKRISRMGINAILLGLVLGGVIGLVTWLLTERPITAMLVGIAPVLLLLCLVRDVFWEPYPNDDEDEGPPPLA